MLLLASHIKTSCRLAAMLSLCGLCISCTTKPVPYQALSSSAQLRSNEANLDGRVPFNTGSDPSRLRMYSAVIMEPVQIYRGTDQQFGNFSEQDKRELADYAGRKFAIELKRSNLLRHAGDRAVLRLRVTLTGAQNNVPGLSTATKVTPIGLALGSVRLVRGKEGRFSGSVIYAAEFFDADNGKLVYAFITRQYPNALNLQASILPKDAAKAGLDRGAISMAAALSSLLQPRLNQE